MKTIPTPSSGWTRHCRAVGAAFSLALLCFTSTASAQAFVHPGGLHTQADLDRMRDQVAANASPWIESWNALITNSKAQTTYTPAPTANPGQNRQRASADAVAAYLNAIRGYVGNSTAHTDHAISILNAWASTVNQIPTGADQPGLNGIFTYQFAVVGEILRIHVGTRWAQADFDRFKNMMSTYLYPVCDDFLLNHRGTCISHYWANWDLCNMAAILAIGVLCDDQPKFDQAIAYFQTGAGNGSILNAIPFVHAGNLGQWQESGRDQEHALLGLGMMATFCEIARNQGLDMYGYSSNRLLAAAEYSAKYNLWNDVPYSFYNNCDNVKNYWPSEYTWGGRGRLQRPIWEQLYNHYVVRMGLSAPYLTAMASVNRPEALSHDDHFGYGTLAFTLNAAASPYPPVLPPAPTGLTASAGVGRVFLKWNPADRARGYNVLRATASGGPYTNVGTWTGTYPVFTDSGTANGTTYYYVIQAINQAGTTGNSSEAGATPQAAGALPGGWTRTDIGTNGTAGSASYADVAGGTFVFTASGAGIGGTADGCSFLSSSVTGDATITVRRHPPTWGGGGSQKLGVMMRESNAADAPAFTLTTGDVGTREARAGARTTTGGSMTWTSGNGYTWHSGATWMRLQRAGNTFTASQSTDGTTWFNVVSTTIAMSSTYSVGMVIGSNSTATISTHFDNVTVSTAPVPPPAPTGLAATVGNAQVALSWTASAGATSYNVKRATVSGGPYTTIASPITASYTDTTVANGTTYYYVVSAVNAAGESADSAQVSATPSTAVKFTGTVIGSPGSWSGLGNTIDKVYDNNLTTFYDAASATGHWAGQDFGAIATNVITMIKYCPRASYASRMVGGMFQASNVADFSSGVVTLFTISAAPPDGVLTSQVVANATSYRYARYIGPTNGFCNVAEVEFWGTSGPPAIPPVPTDFTATPGNAQVALSWTASSGAASYNVKRATVSGGPYTTIASPATASYTDTTAVNGTTYYYVVSAVNAAGESANSTQVSVTPSAPAVPAAPSNLTATAGKKKVTINWTDNSTNESGFKIERSTDGVTFAQITTVAANTTSYANTGLTSGSTYWYRVRAYNANGDSTYSNTANATAK